MKLHQCLYWKHINSCCICIYVNFIYLFRLINKYKPSRCTSHCLFSFSYLKSITLSKTSHHIFIHLWLNNHFYFDFSLFLWQLFRIILIQGQYWHLANELPVIWIQVQLANQPVQVLLLYKTVTINLTSDLSLILSFIISLYKSFTISVEIASSWKV